MEQGSEVPRRAAVKAGRGARAASSVYNFFKKASHLPILSLLLSGFSSLMFSDYFGGMRAALRQTRTHATTHTTARLRIDPVQSPGEALCFLCPWSMLQAWDEVDPSGPRRADAATTKGNTLILRMTPVAAP